MYLVGLTGGIASGKSSVAGIFVDHGATLIDADVIAREVVEPGTEGLAKIVERFGEGVLLSDGSLDRDALAAIVFADAEARRDLEAITHPAIGAEIGRRLGELAETDRIVILDAALLVETGRAGLDSLVVVAAEPDTQVERMISDRHMTEADARARINAQSPLAEKLERADEVIWNEGTRAELASETEHVWDRLVEGAHAKERSDRPG